MRPELDRLQRLELHLLGQPTSAEAARWELELLLDPELQADADAQRAVYRGLRQAGRQQLRRELTAIHAHLYAAPGGWPGRLGAVLRAWLTRGQALLGG